MGKVAERGLLQFEALSGQQDGQVAHLAIQSADRHKAPHMGRGMGRRRGHRRRASELRPRQCQRQASPARSHRPLFTSLSKAALRRARHPIALRALILWDCRSARQGPHLGAADRCEARSQAGEL